MDVEVTLLFFQLVPRLSIGVMLEIERILDNKPVRPPMISTLAMRWQSQNPTNEGIRGLESMKDDNEVAQDEKEDAKQGFCEIQWQERTSDRRKFTKKNIRRLDDTSSRSIDLIFSKIDEESEHCQYIPLSLPHQLNSIDSNLSKNLRRISLIEASHASQLTRQNISNDVPVAPASTSIATNIIPSASTAESSRLDHKPVCENRRKFSNILSLKSLSLSLRLLKSQKVKASTETLDKSDGNFQSIAEYNEEHQARSRSRSIFGNQKVYDRRSSMTDMSEKNKKDQKEEKTKRELKKQEKNDPRRPSTNSLLKKAREKTTSENSIKRGVGMSNRRMSMAY